MRGAWIVVVVAACASTAAPPQPASAPAPAPTVVPATPATPPVDAAPAPLAIGARCLASSGEQLACVAGARCAAQFPGGYCTAPCGLVGAACSGACVETSRSGELCMAPCTSDASCRASEGYVCDPVWHACALPGLAAMLPHQCAGSAGEPARDPAFSASAPWSSAASTGVYQFEPAAALAGDGGVVAVYIGRAGIFAGNQLGVARIDGRGKAVLDATLAAPNRASQFDPWLARGKDGTVYAIWYAFDGRDENGEIALATSRDGGATWSAPIDVHEPADCGSDATECLDKPMVAVGPHPRGGAREVVYAFYSTEQGGLRARASLDGGRTFAAPTTVTEGIYGNAVVATDGNVHVATLRGGPSERPGTPPRSVDYAVSTDAGATWQVHDVLAAGERVPFFFSNPTVAADARRGWVYVAYARIAGDAAWDIALAATRDGGKTWTRTSLGDGCAVHMVPNLALDPATGTLHVAWYDSEGAVGRFAHATCTPGLAACTRRGAINSVPFAALSMERHGAKWIGEYESLIVDDKRRVLHAVWTQPVGEGDHAVSRIFHAVAKL
jgi:hypothetical protein